MAVVCLTNCLLCEIQVINIYMDDGARIGGVSSYQMQSMMITGQQQQQQRPQQSPPQQLLQQPQQQQQQLQHVSYFATRSTPITTPTTPNLLSAAGGSAKDLPVDSIQMTTNGRYVITGSVHGPPQVWDLKVSDGNRIEILNLKQQQNCRCTCPCRRSTLCHT